MHTLTLCEYLVARFHVATCEKWYETSIESIGYVGTKTKAVKLVLSKHHQWKPMWQFAIMNTKPELSRLSGLQDSSRICFNFNKARIQVLVLNWVLIWVWKPSIQNRHSINSSDTWLWISNAEYNYWPSHKVKMSGSKVPYLHAGALIYECVQCILC